MCNKGDAGRPDIRARLLACELNTFKSDDFFASTPPLEAKRLLLSQLASQRFHPDGRKLQVSFVDIKKAYFNAVPKRLLYVFLPKEMGQGPKSVARLRRCVYGTRDAGMLWEECYSTALTAMGFRRGLASPCCFFHKEKHIRVVIHGDGFTALGAAEELRWYEQGLSNVFELVVKGRLGEDKGCDREVRVLNRVVRLDADGVKYEADPRHSEMLVQSGGVELGNSRVTPGQKPDAEKVDYEAVLNEVLEAEIHAGQRDGEHAVAEMSKCGAQSSTSSVPRNIDSKLASDTDAHHSVTTLSSVSSVVSSSRGPLKSILKVTASSSTTEVNSTADHAGSCSTTVSKKVRFVAAKPPETFHICPYSEIYGQHPSGIVATRRGFKRISVKADPFTGKSTGVMHERRDVIYNNERLAALHRERAQILDTALRHGSKWESNAGMPQLSLHSLLVDPRTSQHDREKLLRKYAHDDLFSLITAVRTPSANSKVQKRQGAKKVKHLEHAQATSDSQRLTPEGASVYRALAARCNYLAQDRPDLAYSAKELCREF